MTDIISTSDRKDWIPLEACKDGYLYYIHARNSHLGIFSAKDKAFTISRIKFNDNYLFDEYHWDTGEPYGTVKPIRELEQPPKFSSDKEKLDYLNKKEDEYTENPWVKE